MNGLKHVRPGNGFVPKIDMMKKTDVNGINEHPLFTLLKGKKLDKAPNEAIEKCQQPIWQDIEYLTRDKRFATVVVYFKSEEKAKTHSVQSLKTIDIVYLGAQQRSQ
ncbi:Glutathione peroxidase 6 [Octopus vulgaris]|uniref:Glutathione peroxidase 6 n=1 Tax=Octopus vulgaris TaxID=6645 RepID=A0AA36EZ26_OCTVU|nr:Glutathione peroxidase 6 [Octopus vulgaris]